MASRESTAKVVSAMRSLGRPALVSELVRFTGLTTNTVRAVLKDKGRAEEGYPTRWMPSDVIQRRVGTVEKLSTTVEVPYQKDQNWVEKVVPLGRMVQGLEKALPPTKDSDPKKLYKVVSEAASTLASLAFDIKESMQGPDWYQRLGGKIEETL